MAESRHLFQDIQTVIYTLPAFNIGMEDWLGREMLYIYNLVDYTTFYVQANHSHFL